MDPNTKVSVIIPFVNEWPQVAFTIRSVREELEGFVDYEIIAIDNYCEEVHKQGNPPDRGHDHFVRKGSPRNYGFYGISEEDKKKMMLNVGHMAGMARMNKWLKVLRFRDKLSNWNCKNLAMEKATGELILFLDAHVVPSRNLLRDAITQQEAWGRENHERRFNSLHLPLSYHILEAKRLMYRLVFDSEAGLAHYTFHTMPINIMEPVEVPCMSSCGILMWRELYDALGGWPAGMGIYGGGEHFVNFSMAVMGFKKYLYHKGTLHHHGDKRKYHWNWRDYHTNRLIATACYGHADWAVRYRNSLGGDPRVLDDMLDTAVTAAAENRAIIDKRRCQTIDEWAAQWDGLLAVGKTQGEIRRG